MEVPNLRMTAFLQHVDFLKQQKAPWKEDAGSFPNHHFFQKFATSLAARFEGYPFLRSITIHESAWVNLEISTWKHVSVKLLGEPKPPMMWVWFNEQRRPPPGGFWCGDFDVSLIQEFNWKNDHVGSVTTPVTDFCWNGMEFWYFHVWFIFP